MGSFEKLHLADNLDDLDTLAKRDCNVKTYKFTQICKVLPRLYKVSQQNVLDQEKTYMFLVRYLSIYNYLKNTETDKKFIELKFGSEYEKVLMQYGEVKKSLEERYRANKGTVPVKPAAEEKAIIENKPKRVFYDKFITCQQLFSALENKYNVLLVDARRDDHFLESRIDHKNCINVPDQCITSGLSANILGKKLPPETQKIWENRNTFDVIILYDWNTSADHFTSTKLSKLHSALVDWDLNRNYPEPPVILSGGYLELLHTYPTICINPQVYLYQKNNELDELLELDNIEYPTETDNKTLVMGVPSKALTSAYGGGPATSEYIVLEDADIVLNKESIIAQIQYEEDKRKRINDMCDKENDIKQIANYKERDSEISAEIVKLQKLLADLNKNQDEVKGPETNIQEESEEDLVPELTIIEEEDPEKLKGIIDEQRNKELQKARALKPKNAKASHGKSTKDTEKPVVNRATKPSSNTYNLRSRAEPLDGVTLGLVGLRNLRNTCYMNTLIQCFRNVPAIMRLFCDGTYTKYVIRRPAAIIHETAALVRLLWSKSANYIEPYEFYGKIAQLEPTYKLGNHEDCMEFFLFLLNHLSEDCGYNNTLPDIMTPKQRAWYNQFEGTNSIFIDLFYHQIRITQHCVHCDKKTFKFEIESTFMLPVPEHDFTLDELMSEYMADYIIPDYCCAICKKPVNNEKQVCYEPKIVVIVLKRYRHAIVNGVATLKKIESKANFQKQNFRVGDCLYQLNAIAMHSGNMNFGHYTAAVHTNKGWYEFNDDVVKPMNINDDSFKVKACAFFYSMCDDKEN